MKKAMILVVMVMLFALTGCEERTVRRTETWSEMHDIEVKPIEVKPIEVKPIEITHHVLVEEMETETILYEKIETEEILR